MIKSNFSYALSERLSRGYMLTFLLSVVSTTSKRKIKRMKRKEGRKTKMVCGVCASGYLPFDHPLIQIILVLSMIVLGPSLP